MGLILIINIICLAFFQFISLQLAVVYRSSNVHARGKNAANLRYSGFFLKFHHSYFHFLCDTKKTRIIVLFFLQRSAPFNLPYITADLSGLQDLLPDQNSPFSILFLTLLFSGNPVSKRISQYYSLIYGLPINPICIFSIA